MTTAIWKRALSISVVAVTLFTGTCFTAGGIAASRGAFQTASYAYAWSLFARQRGSQEFLGIGARRERAGDLASAVEALRIAESLTPSASLRQRIASLELLALPVDRIRAEKLRMLEGQHDGVKLGDNPYFDVHYDPSVQGNAVFYGEVRPKKVRLSEKLLLVSRKSGAREYDIDRSNRFIVYNSRPGIALSDLAKGTRKVVAPGLAGDLAMTPDASQFAAFIRREAGADFVRVVRLKDGRKHDYPVAKGNWVANIEWLDDRFVLLLEEFDSMTETELGTRTVATLIDSSAHHVYEFDCPNVSVRFSEISARISPDATRAVLSFADHTFVYGLQDGRLASTSLEGAKWVWAPDGRKLARLVLDLAANQEDYKRFRIKSLQVADLESGSKIDLPVDALVRYKGEWFYPNPEATRWTRDGKVYMGGDAKSEFAWIRLRPS